jgi:hypothetical protein
MFTSDIDWDFGVNVSHFGSMLVILIKTVVPDQHASLRAQADQAHTSQSFLIICSMPLIVDILLNYL